MALETVLSPRRRGWILITAVATTIMFSWASINRLGELVEVQQLPSDVASHSLLELTEQNIASHLHLPHTGAIAVAALPWRRPDFIPNSCAGARCGHAKLPCQIEGCPYLTTCRGIPRRHGSEGRR
jgi:hypothetical protein